MWHAPAVEEYAFVAENEAGQLVGVLICGPIEDAGYRGEIFALFVLPEYHRQGIGKKLVQSAVNKLLALNISSMLVWVLEDNPARCFYEAIGGKQVRKKVVEREHTTEVKIGYGWLDVKGLLADLGEEAEPDSSLNRQD